MVNIALIPIDNRPVCYTLPEQISKIDSNIQLFLPPREMLGDLKKIADINGILNWLKNIENIDKVIISLDTVAHGGLIPSRRSLDSFDDIKNRIENLKNILVEKNAQVYAFSSIMRISNNNVNEEEKEYWNLYGEKIFKYSFEMHKNNNAQTDVPKEIIDDYLNTRKRNFEINKEYLKWVQEGFFDTLVFSKDDCAAYGLNVKEANELQKIIKEKKLNALVKTGADEIPLSLLSRAITKNKTVKIFPTFTEPDYVDKISKYEDVSVFESVKGQIELAGCQVSFDEDDADIVLLVNNFQNEQGELVMGVDVKGFDQKLKLPNKSFLIADIRNANGADNNFVDELFKQNIDKDLFLGYAAWNTTGNTLGSLLCCGLVKFLANKPDELAFDRVQMVRFLDDWAYQANVRKALKQEYTEISIKALSEKMKSYEEIIRKKFCMNFEKISYDFPWNRFFEIEVVIS